MDKIYEQAFKEKRPGGKDKRTHAWGSLAGGAAFSETTKRKGLNCKITGGAYYFSEITIVI